MDTAAGELALPLMGELALALGNGTTPYHGHGRTGPDGMDLENLALPLT